MNTSKKKVFDALRRACRLIKKKKSQIRDSSMGLGATAFFAGILWYVFFAPVAPAVAFFDPRRSRPTTRAERNYFFDGAADKNHTHSTNPDGGNHRATQNNHSQQNHEAARAPKSAGANPGKHDRRRDPPRKRHNPKAEPHDPRDGS